MRKTGFWTTSSKQFKHSTVDIAPQVSTISPIADTAILSSNPTTNYSTSDIILIGDQVNATRVWRGLIKPDFSTLSAGLFFSDVSLFFTPTVDNSDNARTLSVHRVVRSINYATVTWNSPWGTAGCKNSTTDYDGAVVMGSVAIPASPTLNIPIEIPLVASEFQKIYDGTYTNYGIVLFVNQEVNDAIAYASVENATVAYRPYFVVTHT